MLWNSEFIRAGVNTACHRKLGYKGAAAARAALKKFGIGINEASNGVFLKASEHARIHTRAYYEAVNSAMSGATTKQEALQVLSAIRQGLFGGTVK